MFIAGGKTLVMLMALIYSGRKFGTYITSNGQARLHSYTCTHAQAFSLNICFLSLLALQILGGVLNMTPGTEMMTPTLLRNLCRFSSNISPTAQNRCRVLLYFRSSYKTLPITKRQFKGKNQGKYS